MSGSPRRQTLVRVISAMENCIAGMVGCVLFAFVWGLFAGWKDDTVHGMFAFGCAFGLMGIVLWFLSLWLEWRLE